MATTFDQRDVRQTPAPAAAKSESLTGAGIHAGMSPEAVKQNVALVAAGLSSCTPEALAEATRALVRIKEGAFSDPRYTNQLCEAIARRLAHEEPRVRQIG